MGSAPSCIETRSGAVVVLLSFAGSVADSSHEIGPAVIALVAAPLGWVFLPSVVVLGMLTSGLELKVLESVVGSVSVDVVHAFVWPEL
jgi:DNA-binding transcriptional LysR family regulator